MSLDRRTFLKTASAGAAAASVCIPGLVDAAAASAEMKPGAGNKWPGRVAINFNKNAVSGLTTQQPDVIKKMVDDTIKLLTGQATISAAWKELFPATLSLQSKIAIKINTVNTSLPGQHSNAVKAIVDGLQQMDFSGTKFPAANITIYDMNFQDGMSKLGYTKANFPGITIEYTKLVDGGDGALENHKYSATLKNANFLINVFSPRGHSTEFLPAGSKFTLGFKSHIGTYASEASQEGPSLHAKLPTNLREMNCSGVIYNKNVLSFCAGIFALNEGKGPPGEAEDYKTYAKTMDSSITGSANPTTFIMGTDPVAVEMQVIKMMRLNKSGKYGIDDMPPYLKASAGIAGALEGTVYNIGVIDESKMDIRRVINDTTVITTPKSTRVTTSAELTVAPLGDGSLFVEYQLPETLTGKKVVVEIFTLNGARVNRFTSTVSGRANHLSCRPFTGRSHQNGSYIARLTCEGFSCAQQFVMK